MSWYVTKSLIYVLVATSVSLLNFPGIAAAVLVLVLVTFVLDPLSCFPSELIGSMDLRQLVRLLGRGISPVARRYLHRITKTE
jgi:NhaP-type Na+/H+ or K+/H+ antiporter